MVHSLQTAQAVGYQQAFKAITAGLLAAYLILALLDDPLWLFTFDYVPNLLFATLILYGTGYLLGGISGKLILLKKYPAVLVGIVSGFLMTGIAAFLGGFPAFFKEGLQNASGFQEAFEDYILKPVVMIWLWGSIPILGIGIWYGTSVKRRKIPAISI